MSSLEAFNMLVAFHYTEYRNNNGCLQTDRKE